MKRLDEADTYPPARWCPECGRLHNGIAPLAECQCGTDTIPVPEDLIPQTRRGPKLRIYRD